MARNDERRARLADAGLAVLAREGARGLTHRSVDREAGTPVGTASNYFGSRDALIAALVARIAHRLAPREEVHASLAARTPSKTLFADYVRDIVRRLGQDREVALALLELRLEAARHPAIAETLGAWQREAFAADVAFNRAAGLPGGETEIALFHYAIDGLLLDRLTTTIDPDSDTDAVIDTLVDRLLPD